MQRLFSVDSLYVYSICLHLLSDKITWNLSMKMWDIKWQLLIPLCIKYPKCNELNIDYNDAAYQVYFAVNNRSKPDKTMKEPRYTWYCKHIQIYVQVSVIYYSIHYYTHISKLLDLNKSNALPHKYNFLCRICRIIPVC